LKTQLFLTILCHPRYLSGEVAKGLFGLTPPRALSGAIELAALALEDFPI